MPSNVVDYSLYFLKWLVIPVLFVNAVKEIIVL